MRKYIIFYFAIVMKLETPVQLYHLQMRDMNEMNLKEDLGHFFFVFSSMFSESMKVEPKCLRIIIPFVLIVLKINQNSWT